MTFRLRVHGYVLSLARFFFSEEGLFRREGRFVLATSLDSYRLARRFVVVLLTREGPRCGLTYIRLCLVRRSLICM